MSRQTGYLPSLRRTAIPDVLVLEPRVFKDARGHFFESHNRAAFAAAIGSDPDFVQDNHSRSRKGVLRGLHYQIQQPQGKLVRVVSGAIFDVAVDLRRESPTFGRWVGVELSSENFRQMWVPCGFAHGFMVLSESADVTYKTTDYYAPEHERCLRWDEPGIGIAWPKVDTGVVLSPKDRLGVSLAEAHLFDSERVVAADALF
ncbi:MAG: dTDP-4-dehydrorhamnose 3,5-epimerase [Ramlibacter sp.]